MVVHGVGMKGTVMDMEDLVLSDIQTITIYVGKDMVQKTISLSTLHGILKGDYVIKVFGFKPYFLRELEGFKRFLSNPIIGIPYQNTMIYGVEIVTSTETIYFVINRKCKETIADISMSFPEWKRFVIDILSQLVQLQKRNIAHGDIKLDNIMKCKKYQLIDWENSRELDYDGLKQKRFFGLSPMYFQILYGSAWYPTFSLALLKYYKETGGTREYANGMISYFSNLFQHYTPREVFEKTKYALDVGALGFILDGMNPPKRYHTFIHSMYKMSAKEALIQFKKINQTRNKRV